MDGFHMSPIGHEPGNSNHLPIPESGIFFTAPKSESVLMNHGSMPAQNNQPGVFNGRIFQ